VLLVLNILLFVFNMLPVPPLDGASAITGVLPEGAAQVVRAVNAHPAVSMLGLMIAWQLFPEFARPLFAALLRLVHPGDIYF
jgi:Zn-dependent protease